MSQTDTITAIATPAGRGGVGIVRISGSLASGISKNILNREINQPRLAAYRQFIDHNGVTIDEGIALYFPGPNSFTGEDVLELQGHGGPVILDLILQRCIALGARIAQPGEFSERAFLNDKIDLAQAEAIADLIDSGSAKAARSAMRSLQGEFSNKVNFLVDTLINLRLHIEAALDFPEEEIDFLSDNRITQKFENLKAEISQVFEKARQGSLLREGLNLVIVGQPNAGKSSLLNRLAGRDAAIVTHIPGTTRDVLKEYIQIDGMPLHILDTAGLRDSEDIVEQEGIKRTWNEIHQADLIALLIDDNAGFNQQDQLILDQLPSRLPVLRIHNKIDISQHAPGKSESGIYLSAKTGEGFTELELELKKIIGYQEDAEGLIIARRRHLDALETASEEITAAENQLIKNQAGELVAEHLRVAQDALSTITGKFTADDLLGEIFSSFCIGK